MKYFNLIDEWAERFTDGDLLDEYQISQAMDRLTGALMKIGPVAGALEALQEEKLQNQLVKEYETFEKMRVQDSDIAKANARSSISRLRKMSTDFRNYFYASQSGVITAQSRLKRLTVEKGAKKVDYTGEQPVTETGDSPEVKTEGWK